MSSDERDREIVTLHDLPTARQLLEAVREWMERDVLTTTSGRVQFHTRVAINVLAMVERELALGAEQLVRHRERLASLGFDNDVDLAAAIRRGELDGDLERVVAAVRADVVDKLRVANPGYFVAGDT
ncbi:MAG: DUF6285 domain-containing protein [Ilumatobacteraceae bacterium]